MIINFVCLLGRGSQDVHESTLKVLSIEGLVGFNCRIGIRELDVGEAFALLIASVKGHVNLEFHQRLVKTN